MPEMNDNVRARIVCICDAGYSGASPRDLRNPGERFDQGSELGLADCHREKAVCRNLGGLDYSTIKETIL
jgi:hypothetical protein